MSVQTQTITTVKCDVCGKECDPVIEKYLMRARVDATDGKFDEAIFALIFAVEELADRLSDFVSTTKTEELVKS